jgi:hypothetical protein
VTAEQGAFTAFGFPFLGRMAIMLTHSHQPPQQPHTRLQLQPQALSGMMEAGPSAPSHSSYLPASLLHPLSNSLVLDQIVAYLPVSSLLALGATSKSFKDLVHRTPNVFRHLDLSNVKSAQFDIANIDNGGEVWRNVQLDENVTEDESVASLIPNSAC